MGGRPLSGFVLFLTFYALSRVARTSKAFGGLSFTFQIFAFVSLALYFPSAFTNWGFDTKALVVPSVQLIMFGMGTKLSLGDFAREFRKPLKVLTGTVLVYTIMPLLAPVIVLLYPFPDAVAAGIILLGVCPVAASSNVMTYLANGNIALSLSITMLSTFVSPVVTPLLMRMLAGQLIAVDTVGMMISILNMIMVPVAAGLICNRILYGDIAWLRRQANLVLVGLAALVGGLSLLYVEFASRVRSLQSGLILVCGTIAAVSFSMVVVRRVNGPANWMDLALPRLSLASIMLYIVIVSAHNRDTLLSIGPALFIASTGHNLAGFALGYASAKLLRLNDRDVRTFTIEAGLKNSGLGVGLAYDVLKSEAAALSCLIASSWMNVSGSTLANFWRQRPPREDKPTSAIAQSVAENQK
jgi:BASS family bile acid:Na+ symporter